MLCIEKMRTSNTADGVRTRDPVVTSSREG